MSFKQPRTISHLIRATCCSLAGLKAAFTHEFAFRLEIYLTIIVIPSALLLGNNGVERALLLSSWLLILLVEIINSSIECVVDRISEEHHALSGRAKDLSSAAVFLACAFALLVWILIILG